METNVLIIKNESLERFLIENFNVDAREIRGCTSYYHLMKNEIALKKSDMLKLDDNIEFVRLPVQQEADGIGADWHPSENTHTKMAILLSEKINGIFEKMGM